MQEDLAAIADERDEDPNDRDDPNGRPRVANSPDP